MGGWHWHWVYYILTIILTIINHHTIMKLRFPIFEHQNWTGTEAWRIVEPLATNGRCGGGGDRAGPSHVLMI
jgi:hypothetical protein